MDAEEIIKFYNIGNEKFACARIFNDFRCCIQNNTLDIDNIFKRTHHLNEELKVLSHFHYKLLRLIMKKSKCEQIKSKWMSTMIRGLLNSVKNVSSADSIIVQREYLKILCSVIKNNMEYDKDIMKEVINWFSINPWTLLDKYFLKIFKGITVHGLLDSSDNLAIISSLDEKGYKNILFCSSKDFFIDVMSLELTPQLQSQALELVLNIFYSALCSRQTDVAFKIVGGGNSGIEFVNVDLLRGYIKSILTEDDVMFLSNLHIAAKISKMLASSDVMRNNAGFEQLVELFDIQYWFHHFAVHIQFDHKLVLDWLLDGDELCQNYLLFVLPVISSDFWQFVEFLSTVIPDESTPRKTLEDVMDFLIRLNFSIHEVNTEISSIIDEIETKYESFGDVPMSDPLSGILSSKFTTQCSISKMCVETEGSNYLGLVSYSDSD